MAFSHHSGSIPIDGSFRGLATSAFNNLTSPHGKDIVKDNLNLIFGNGKDNNLISGSNLDPADALANYYEKLGLAPTASENPYYYDSNSASASSPTTPQQLQYIDAPYAQHYGMDASTAYQEALANTAYQRKVKDLQAAGLNPVLGINGSGAASFYGSPAGSSGGGFGSYGSAKSTASEEATKLQYWLPTLVNGVTNAVFTLGTKNGMTGYAAGTIAQNVVSGLLGAVRNHG